MFFALRTGARSRVSKMIPGSVPGDNLFRGELFDHVFPELFKPDIIKLVRKKHITPGPPVNPLNYLIDTEINSFRAFYRDKMVTDFRVAAPSATHRDMKGRGI